MVGSDRGGLCDAAALVGIVQHREQVLYQRLRMLGVPLQGAPEARVVETGQGPIKLCAKPAQFGHQLRREVGKARQRLTLDVFQQADPQWLVCDVQGQQGFATECRAHAWHGQAMLAQVGEGRMLGLQFDLGVAAMACLEHEAALRRDHTQVQVLLAAQGRQLTGEAVVGLQQALRLGGAEHRAWQAGTLDQRVEGRGGSLGVTGHGLYR